MQLQEEAQPLEQSERAPVRRFRDRGQAFDAVVPCKLADDGLGRLARESLPPVGAGEEAGGAFSKV